MNAQQDFSNLIPDVILDAVESLDFWTDARIYPLNSYENRVYQVGIEDSAPLIAKFYRPHRWQRAQIQEEHDTLLALAESGFPLAAPLQINGHTLFQHQGWHFCLTPRLVGQHPEAENLDQLFQIGELIGKLHQALSHQSFQQRPSVSPLEQINQAATDIINSGHMPTKLQSPYQASITKLLSLCEKQMQSFWPHALRPIHGDSHRSNLLMVNNEFHLLDFDDCQNGVAIQDLWLHLTDLSQSRQQLSELIEGYESYAAFDVRELALIDVFKATRIICYAAWLSNRWQDPAFVKAFPWFTSEEYWLNHLNELKACQTEWGQLSL
ncbi:serine/threonine protein kinase [Marinomonas sp. THO17]|uniref:serine/threonine protein kinase n=1 Tax=Marinomonas sp. THO17 TaxID=3149048 RepID=UPI00336C2798